MFKLVWHLQQRISILKFFSRCLLSYLLIEHESQTFSVAAVADKGGRADTDGTQKVKAITCAFVPSCSTKRSWISKVLWPISQCHHFADEDPPRLSYMSHIQQLHLFIKQIRYLLVRRDIKTNFFCIFCFSDKYQILTHLGLLDLKRNIKWFVQKSLFSCRKSNF